MDRELLKDEIILTYREMISERYRYDTIISKHDIPDSFDESKLSALKSFFLDYIYPSPQERDELDHAFDTLQDFINNPARLLKLLRDSSSLVLTMGWQLPKILKAGLGALQSFKAANKLEELLITEVTKLNPSSKIDADIVNKALGRLPQHVVSSFIEDTLRLFNLLQDRKLVSRVIKVVNTLISKMENRNEAYSAEEIQAVALGRDLISAGDELFKSLSKEEQKHIFDVIASIERQHLHEIMSSTSDSIDD